MEPDLDPDLEGPKTDGSGSEFRSGSETLVVSLLYVKEIIVPI
jgi:hypothetical protein